MDKHSKAVSKAKGGALFGFLVSTMSYIAVLYFDSVSAPADVEKDPMSSAIINVLDVLSNVYTFLAYVFFFIGLAFMLRCSLEWFSLMRKGMPEGVHSKEGSLSEAKFLQEDLTPKTQRGSFKEAAELQRKGSS